MITRARDLFVNLSLGAKLGLGFGAQVVLFALSMLLANANNSGAVTAIARTNEISAPSALVSSRAQANLLRMVNDVRGYLVVGDAGFREDYTVHRTLFERDLAMMTQSAPLWRYPEDRARLDTLKNRYEDWAALPEHMFALHDDVLVNQPARRILQQQGELKINLIVDNFSKLIDAQAAQTASAQNQRILKSAADLRSAFGLFVAALRGYVYTGDPLFKFEADTQLAAYNSAWEALSTDADGLAPSGRAAYDSLSQLQTQFFALPPEIYTAVEGERGYEDLYVFRAEFVPLSETLLSQLSEITLSHQAVLEDDLNSSRAALASSQQENLIGTIGAVALALILAIIFRRQIAGPVLVLTEAAERVNAGDLSYAVPIFSHDEIGRLAETFNNMTAKLRHTLDTLEQRVADRTRALETSARVSRQLSTILDRDALVLAVVQQVQEAFGYYHVQIFLHEREQNVLLMVGGTGEAGRAMLARRHALPFGKGMVGRVAQTGTMLLATDVKQDEHWVYNPLLPQTCAEAVVPIALAGTVLGVLDVQHNRPGMLQQADADLLQSIASQVAVALENARLYAQAQEQIAERERAQQALSKALSALDGRRTELEAVNRELQQFAYVTSHDLKAPLRAISNLSEWIEEDLGEHVTEDSRQHMLLLRGRVHRMEALIDGILQYSRIGRQHAPVETVAVAQLLDEIIDSLQPPVGFSISVAPDMPTLPAERVRLHQVFANLLSNALKYHHAPATGHVWISVRDAGAYYEFVVRDDGPGIAPQYHEKVFVIFQTLQARDTYESTGVGLALVKKIVEDQRGQVLLTSDVGQGATFRFTWPKEPVRKED